MAPSLRGSKKLRIFLCGTREKRFSKGWELYLPIGMEAQSLGRILDQREVEKALAPIRYRIFKSDT